jgi:hypothetical protein
VTIGLGSRDFLDKMKAEKFKPFTFKARSVEVYQLGEFGTAQKRLWSSVLEPVTSRKEGQSRK